MGRLGFDWAAVRGNLRVETKSYSDGGRFTEPESALRQAEAMAIEGAAIIDVGGESTRPGATAVTAQQEIDRIGPIIERICDGLDVPVSIDTSKPAVKIGRAHV